MQLTEEQLINIVSDVGGLKSTAESTLAAVSALKESLELRISKIEPLEQQVSRIEPLEQRVSNLEPLGNRVSKLENWRFTIVGALAIIVLLLGFLSPYLSEVVSHAAQVSP